MRKSNKKSRKFRFYSEKNKKMVEVYDERALNYAQSFEENSEIASYEACVQLDMSRYVNVNRVDIRKEYFETQWESDFLIRFTDGTSKVIELITRRELEKRSFIEKLDFSVRYWRALDIEWAVYFKVVGVDKDDDAT